MQVKRWGWRLSVALSVLFLIMALWWSNTPVSPPALAAAVRAAGAHGWTLRWALAQATPAERPDLAFLIMHMPTRDRRTLSAGYLLENVRCAQAALRMVPWADRVPPAIYREYLLPYAAATEPRERWRAGFAARFQPLVQQCRRPGEAALLLNRTIYTQLGVRYHPTRARRPDQGPLESTVVRYASCTGLSILLVDACRAVGVPARLVGVAHWTGMPGNHTWVEVWDDGWHCLGAAEGAGLDQGWFTTRAGKADLTDLARHVYAATFTRGATYFPLAWDPANTDVGAVDVTAMYRTRFGSISPSRYNTPTHQ